MKQIISLFIALIFLGGCATDTAVEEDQTDTAVQETTQEETTDTENSEESEEADTSEPVSDSEAETIEVSTTFEIDGEVEENMSGTYEVEAGTTLLDFMKDEFEVEETDGFIESINSYTQKPEEDLYWLYEINGEFAAVGAAEYELEERDDLFWTLNPME